LGNRARRAANPEKARAYRAANLARRTAVQRTKRKAKRAAAAAAANTNTPEQISEAAD
jgi:hypothetical protein